MEKVLGAEVVEQLEAELSQLRAWKEGREGLLCPHDDPYAEASIIFGGQPALSVDQRETRRVMKRKVLRHRPDGRVEVSDESVITVNSENNAEPWSLGHSRTLLDDTISGGEIESSSGSLGEYLHYDDDEWLPEDSPCSLLGDFGSETMTPYSAPARPPTSYVIPQVGKLKKTDPVAKLYKYRQNWERFSFPGEDPHQELRWAMRQQMLQPGLPCPAQKRLVPNMYVVPTMKQRAALRWRVRQDLAHCRMPRRNTTS